MITALPLMAVFWVMSAQPGSLCIVSVTRREFRLTDFGEGVFVRMNEGGMTPREVSSRFRRRSSLFSEVGKVRKLAYSADLRSVDFSASSFPYDVHGMTPSQGVRTEAKNLPFIVVAHAQ